MKELPIFYDAAMVRATLNGNKTMAHQIVKGGFDCRSMCFAGIQYHQQKGVGAQAYFHDAGSKKKYGIQTTYQPGDIIYVREVWAECTDSLGIPIMAFKDGSTFVIGADNELISPTKCEWDIYYSYPSFGKWSPSSKMPKKAARIWLQCTDVKCHRVRDISEDAAKAEGVDRVYKNIESNYMIADETTEKLLGQCGTYRTGFECRWVAKNGLESWNLNDWCFAYTFELLSITGRPENS